MFYISFLIGFGILFSWSSAAAVITELSPEHACMAKIEKEIKGIKVTKTLGSIVGIGWNDLSNVETRPIFATTYKDCQTTSDNTFLIPDGVVAIPLHATTIDRTSEKYDSFSDFKSSNSKGFSVSGGGEFDGFGISGSMSYETTTAKEHMEKLSRTGFSNKIEYHAYNLIANENVGFDKYFSSQVNEIADELIGGNKLLAQHKSEQIIGDYGTHVINRALTGAKGVMLGFTSAKSEQDQTDFKNQMSLDFNAKFMGIGNLGAKITETSETSHKSGTTTSTSHTLFITKGDVEAKTVADNVGNKIIVNSVVALERKGVTIHSLINEELLEHHNSTTVEAVRKLIYDATHEFYKRNTIPGCTDPTKFNYFFKANVEDGTCKEVKSVELTNEMKEALLYAFYFDRPFNRQAFIDQYMHLVGAFYPAPSFGGILQDCYVEDTDNYCDNYITSNFNSYWHSCMTYSTRKQIGDFYATSKNNVSKVGCTVTECPKNDTVTRRLRVFGCFIDNDYKLGLLEWNQVLNEPTEIQSVQQMYNDENFFLRNSFLNPLKSVLNAIRQIVRNNASPENFIRSSPTNFRYKIERALALLHSVEHDIYIQSAYKLKILALRPESFHVYMFGGIFDRENIFSENGRCELGFQEYPFSFNLKICLASPTEDTVSKSVEFGGMISCHDGNQECPQGLSKYLATTINGCSYYYCASVGVRNSEANSLKLKNPPYVDLELAKSGTRYIHQLDEDEKE